MDGKRLIGMLIINMSTYAAFLGNHPTISLAELRAFVPDFTVRRMIGPAIAIFDTAQTLSNKDLDAWGGIFMMAQELPGSHSIKDVPELLHKTVSNVKGKVTFSIRSSGVDKRAIHNLYRDCKKKLTGNSIPTRYIGNEMKPAVSVQLHQEGLITGKNGAEIVLLGDDEDSFLWVGRTIAAQDPNAYTKRDMEKPVRDTRAGLLPPKLAQIMLNLGYWVAHQQNPSLKKKINVYDPFCGTGVIPIESLIRGWPIWASDLSVKAVNGCEKNLDWIRKEMKILKKDVASEVWKHDATKTFDLPVTPDVIVTETMLGPALADRPNSKDAAKYRVECDDLEIAFLQNVAQSLPGVPVVATFPCWYLKTGPIFLEKVWKKLSDIGFEAVLPQGSPSDSPEHPSLIYRRTEQFVGREIVILKPLKK